MAKVTVGVPVYNGAEYLDKCLTCLRDQTYRDIEVLIFDNCSEDATSEIAQRFCAADSRFRYFRQPENLGPVANFAGVLEAAQAPFFMWRAADDTSDLDYIETLVALLLAHPERDLAVARVVASLPDGRGKRVYPVPRLLEKGGAAGRLVQIYQAHAPTWFYGLFRREAILSLLRKVVASYPYFWGWDDVTMFALTFDRKVIGTNATTFYQYLRFAPPKRDAVQRAKRDDEKLEMGRSLVAFAHRHVDQVITAPAERWFYHLVVAHFGHKRGYSFTKRLRRSLIRSTGLVPRRPNSQA
jgi:glycosyltransferase involved in cell wall biosynthesis